MDIEDLNLIAEEVADDYMHTSKLENYLVVAVREVIRGNTLPRNPFPRILRSLRQSLWYNTSLSDMKVRRNKFVSNFVKSDSGKPYGVTTVRKAIDVYGYTYILERVNLENIQFIKKYMNELVLPFETTNGKHESIINYSLGGSFIFESFLNPHPYSYSQPIQIHAHQFIEGPKLRKALEMHI